MDQHHHHYHHDMAADPMAMDMGGGISGGGGGHRCSMSMLFTWNTKDLCLVFRWWHVSGPVSLVFSLLAVVLLGMGYEFVRELSRRYEARVDARSTANTDPESTPCCAPATESSSLLLPVGAMRNSPAGKRGHIGKGLFYGAQVFYSFFIMLLFMTYNGWVMLAVAVGAFLGYVMWGGAGSAAKSVACH